VKGIYFFWKTKWFWRVSNAKSEKINLNFINEVILDGFNRQKWEKKFENEVILEGFNSQKCENKSKKN